MFFIFGLCFSAHKLSLSFSLQALNARVGYIRKLKIKYSTKIIKFSNLQVSNGTMLGVVGEDKIGFIPAYYQVNGGFDEILNRYFNLIFDTSLLSPSEKKIAVDNFKQNMAPIFELINYQEYKRNEKDYSRAYTFNPTGMTYSRESRFLRALQAVGWTEKLGFIHYPDPTKPNDRLSLTHPEGLTIRSLLANQTVFLSDKKTVIVIGPEIIKFQSGSLKSYHTAHSTNNLNLSIDYLVRAGIVSEMGGGKPIELLVVGTAGITEDDIRKRIDTIIGDGEEYRRQVGAALPNERHSALMGGVGLFAGYHHHTKNFIFNLRSGVDHIWGKFRQSGPQNADTENMPKLGWGITLGTGVDYKFTEKSTIGIEGGVRLSEFKIPQQDKPTDTKSSWFIAPYAQIICGFYPTPDYSVSVFTGYFFPRTFAVKTEGSRITEGTKCKVDGIFGGLRFSRYF